MAAEGARLFGFGLRTHGVVAVLAFDAHRHFAQRVDARGDGVNDEFQQSVWCIHDLVDGFVRRIDRPGAHRGADDACAVRPAQAHSGGGHAQRAAHHLHLFQREHFARLIDLIGDNGFEIGVGDRFLLVSQILETHEGLIEFFFGQRIAEFAQPLLQRVTPGMLAQHQPRLRDADGFGAHDLVRLMMLEHPVLMDARFVGKRVRADDGFVRLDDHAGIVAHQFADTHDLRGVDSGFEFEYWFTGVQRHHHFFERRVACALADAVDRQLGLPRPGGDACQRVRGCQPEVVVAVDGDGALLDPRRVLDDALDQFTELVRRGVADGVGDVEGSGPGPDRFAQHDVQKLGVTAASIFGAELDIVAQVFRVSHHLGHALDHLLGIHLQLVLHVNLGRGEERVDTGALRVAHGFPRFVDVILVGAGEAADHGRFVAARRGRGADFNRDAAHGFEIVRRCGGEPGFDDVHAEAGERAGHFQFFGRGHRRARRLLAIAQGSVEDADVVVHGECGTMNAE